jgi:formylglycine-generating enzyme
MKTLVTKSLCCVPSKPLSSLWNSLENGRSKRGSPTDLETVLVPGGKPIVGTRWPRIQNNGEELRECDALTSFRMAATTVTNAQFKQFVDATGYVTEAERFGWSFVFWSEVPKNIPLTQGVAGLEWWRRVEGSNWRDINGPGTYEQAWFSEHPVVQVSWNDAVAFAEWAGGRLPTETEWEHAARGGQGDVPYPWGHKEPDETKYFPCNIWQGTFPNRNTSADGFRTTAPARCFKPNDFGLYNVVGNVWEWTTDEYHIFASQHSGGSTWLQTRGHRVAKGGSYLCHRSYCWRYRIAARVGNAPDSTSPHMGFRLAFEG